MDNDGLNAEFASAYERLANGKAVVCALTGTVHEPVISPDAALLHVRRSLVCHI